MGLDVRIVSQQHVCGLVHDSITIKERGKNFTPSKFTVLKVSEPFFGPTPLIGFSGKLSDNCCCQTKKVT